MGTALGRVMPNTKCSGSSLPAGRDPRRRAQSGHAISGVGQLRRAAPLHRELPAPGRANGPRLGGCAHRVLAPDGVSVRFRRCATGLAIPFLRGLPLSPVFVNDKIQTL